MDLPADRPACLGATVGPAKLVFPLGAPRSGTTWLAKLFDCHPDVLDRNEPDSVLQDPNLPLICPLDAVEQYNTDSNVAPDAVARLKH